MGALGKRIGSGLFTNNSVSRSALFLGFPTFYNRDSAAITAVFASWMVLESAGAKRRIRPATNLGAQVATMSGSGSVA